MPIKWKKRFDPMPILKRIDSSKTINADGSVSFSLFFDECMPALHSMLDFPPAAGEVDVSHLVWRAVSTVKTILTPANVLAAANGELTGLMSTRVKDYRLLTSISIRRADIGNTAKLLGCSIVFLENGFPQRFVASRGKLISQHKMLGCDSPASYCNVIVAVRAKSPSVAVSKATRALDFQRSLWCLFGNSSMEMTFGGAGFKPINKVRLGGYHSVHLPAGESAVDGLWFEPGYVEATSFVSSKPEVMVKNCRWAKSRIARCSYGEAIVDALIRYVRALDEKSGDVAFLPLWSAVEALVTPGHADYNSFVRRCSFIFKEGDYHRQILEHLREYRNTSVHSGLQSDKARTFCFQLQQYFFVLVKFHLGHAGFFKSLEEANHFLDSPPAVDAIRRQVALGQKAIRFMTH